MGRTVRSHSLHCVWHHDREDTLCPGKCQLLSRPMGSAQKIPPRTELSPSTWGTGALVTLEWAWPGGRGLDSKTSGYPPTPTRPEQGLRLTESDSCRGPVCKNISVRTQGGVHLHRHVHGDPAAAGLCAGLAGWNGGDQCPPAPVSGAFTITLYSSYYY